MSSLFYSALATPTRAPEPSSAAAATAFSPIGNAAASEACVAEAYEGRMQEIRDIMSASR
jgi:hypothetical protein